MKRKILVSMLVIILAFFGVYCSKKAKTPSADNKYGLIEYLPSDSLFVFKIKDLARVYNEFLDSDFYYNFMNYEMIKTVEKQLDSSDFSKFEKEFGIKPSFKQLIDLFGKDVIISAGARGNQPIINLLIKYDDVTGPLIEKIDRQLPEKLKNGEETVAVSKYKNITIKSLKVFLNDLLTLADKNRDVRSETNFHYFFTDGLFVISNDLTSIHNIIDLYKNEKTEIKSITKDALFLETFANLDLSSQALIYFKMKEISENIINYLKTLNFPNIDKTFQTWEIVKSTGSTFDLKPKTIIKSYTVFNKETENKNMLKLMQKKAGNLQTPNLVPINALMYISSNLIDAKLMFETYREYFDDAVNKELDKFLENFKKNVKFDFVEDVLNNIGGEMSLALFDIEFSMNPTDAFNSIALISEIKDKKKIDKIIDNSLKSSNVKMSIEKDIYNKSEIFKFVDKEKSYIKNNVSYAYKDNYLILSSYDTLKKMLDASQDESKSIMAKAKLSELKEKFKQSNSFLYFDFRQFVNNIRNVAESLSIFFDPNDNYFSLYAIPVFDILSYLDTISGYSKNDDNGVFSEMYLFMSTPQHLMRKAVAADDKKIQEIPSDKN